MHHEYKKLAWSRVKNFVFTDFQPRIDSVSGIIIKYCNENLEYEGPNVRKDVLKTASVSKIDGYSEADELVSLLKHRHIISQMNGDTLCMPSLLPNSDLSDNTPNNLLSFLVRFKNKYCQLESSVPFAPDLVTQKTGILMRFFFRVKYVVWERVLYGITFTALMLTTEWALMKKMYPHKWWFNICIWHFEKFAKI